MDDVVSCDLAEPVEIAKDTFWVGYRNPKTMFHLNPYLRVFKGDKVKYNFLIDPGSPMDYLEVTQKASKIVGDISKIHAVTINHPDPDVGMSAVYLEKVNPKLTVFTTLENWRLLAHMDFKSSSFKAIEDFKNLTMRLSTGHTIRFIPTPHCHFRGAFAIYDIETRVLFTGDLFGGITGKDSASLYADKDSLEGIKVFHQVYMPSSAALKRAVKKIRKLNPKPLVIAPQHGGVLKGDMIDEVLNMVYNLPVGMDVIPDDEQDNKSKLYISIANEIVESVVSIIGKEQTGKILSKPEITHSMNIEGTKVVDINVESEKVVEVLVHAFAGDEDDQNATKISFVKLAFARIFHSYNIPVPVSLQVKSDDLDITFS
ncbi:MAG: MBL fold hydrolase [Nitrospirae bacterium]|nr:MBL fold hydrolase [Nitrospirota bacterium]